MIPITEFYKAMGVPASQSSEVADLRATVLAQWDSQTRRSWGRQTGIVEVRRPGFRDLSMRIQSPNITVTQVRGWFDGGDPVVYTEGTDYSVRSRNFMTVIRPLNTWPDNVEITYDRGWESIPPEYDDIRQAILSQAVYMQQRFKDDRGVQNSLGFEGGNTTFMTSGFSLPFREAVKRYKNKI